MATYQPVMNNTWDDPAFQSWSADAKLIFLNLITSHRHNPIGLYAVTLRSIAQETNLPEDRAKTAFEELQKPIFGYARVEYDSELSVIWIVNALRHQPGVKPENRHLVKHIQNILEQYYSSSLTVSLKTYYSSKDFAWLFKGLGRGLEGATKGTKRIGKDRIGLLSTSLSTKTKEETPHQVIINRFLELQGTARESLSRDQVTGAYKRHSRAALALIKESGGLENARAALEWGSGYFDTKGLTWTLDTIAKHLPTFAKCGRNDALAKQHGLTSKQVHYAKQLADWLASDAGSNGRSPADAKDRLPVVGTAA